MLPPGEKHDEFFTSASGTYRSQQARPDPTRPSLAQGSDRPVGGSEAGPPSSVGRLLLLEGGSGSGEGLCLSLRMNLPTGLLLAAGAELQQATSGRPIHI